MKGMLQMQGLVKNLYLAPEGKTKTGETFGGEYKVQIEGGVTLRNGELRMDLISMNTKDPESFRPHLQKIVRFDVGVFVQGSQLHYFIPEGAVVEASK